MTIDEEIKCKLLKPLRKRKLKVDRKAVLHVLDRLEQQVHGEQLLFDLSQSRKKTVIWQDIKEVRAYIDFVRALYVARRIARHEYFFYVSMPIERVHDDRWMEGVYSEIDTFSSRIEAVERKHGLKEGEFWPLNEGPKEYQLLNQEYNLYYDYKMVETYREFGLDTIADLYDSNRKEFDRLHERGRRSVFHKDETVVILKDSILHYEEQAQQAASSGAYLAAVTALGSGLEGLLILLCLQSIKEAVGVASTLSSRKRPPKKTLNDPTKWTFDQLIEVCLAAKWLPNIETPYVEFIAAGLAHKLRLMRNNIHPGRIVRERPWWEADERDYKDAEDIYRALVAHIIFRD